MKKVLAGIVVLILPAFFAARSNVHAAEPAINAEPPINNISAVVKQIDRAKSQILVQAQGLNSKDIADALVKAHKRGVRTEIIIDKGSLSLKTPIADYIRKEGIPIYIDAGQDISQDKIIIVDRQTVITDSFNFRKAPGETSTGNLLILKSYELAKMYTDDWNRHRKHSGLYTGKQ